MCSCREIFWYKKKRLCPFRLQAKEHVGGGWSVYFTNGKRNHDLPEFNEGRATIGRLSKDELNSVQVLTKSHVPLSQIMKILSWMGGESLTIVKHIYNAHQESKTDTMCGRSVMQQLMKLIVDNNYLQ